MPDFEKVKELGLLLPDVVDGTAYGARALKLRGKLLACVPTNKSAEANSAVVRVDIERRAALIERHPETYYVTDHYAPHPTVLVRLSNITDGELKRLLRDAWRFVSSSAPPRIDDPGSRAKRSAGLARKKLRKPGNLRKPGR